MKIAAFIRNIFKKYENRVSVRRAREEDVEEIMGIECKVWPEEMRATREMLLSRIRTFPEGFLCVIKNGKILGFVCSEIIHYKDTKKKDFNWYNLTDNGFIAGSHNSKGDSLYGISLSALSQNKNGKTVTTALFDALGKLIIKNRLKRGIFGARIPKYFKYAENLPVEQYVFTRTKDGFFLDPELALYQALGIYPVRVIKDYFKDEKSLNYGVLVTWKNPYYKLIQSFHFLTPVLSKLWKARIYKSDELLKIGKKVKFYMDKDCNKVNKIKCSN